MAAAIIAGHAAAIACAWAIPASAALPPAGGAIPDTARAWDRARWTEGSLASAVT